MTVRDEVFTDVDSWSPSFSDGMFVGCRWFDAQKIARFLFGFGISYTKFEYSGLKVESAEDGGLDVSFRLHDSRAVASGRASVERVALLENSKS